jgi:hypothetical protein
VLCIGPYISHGELKLIKTFDDLNSKIYQVIMKLNLYGSIQKLYQNLMEYKYFQHDPTFICNIDYFIRILESCSENLK